MKRAIQYISHNKIRLNGYSVVTVHEAMRVAEIVSSDEKDEAQRSFCLTVCRKQCDKRSCGDYLRFCELIGYSTESDEDRTEKEIIDQQQLLF